eukprot:891860-Prymnesium_polylepis.1
MLAGGSGPWLRWLAGSLGGFEWLRDRFHCHLSDETHVGLPRWSVGLPRWSVGLPRACPPSADGRAAAEQHLRAAAEQHPRGYGGAGRRRAAGGDHRSGCAWRRI